MRDYAELVKALRFAFEEQDCGECALAGTDRCAVWQSCRFKDAADAIEELLAERGKALNRLCELCGVCSEKSRSPMECEIAGFVEPPKEENAHD